MTRKDDNTRNKELARRLKAARIARGLSQDDVGKHLGISSRSVSQWEVGKASPKADKMKPLADFLSVSMESLWGNGKIPEGLPTIKRMSRKRGEEIRQGTDRPQLTKSNPTAPNENDDIPELDAFVAAFYVLFKAMIQMKHRLAELEIKLLGN